MEKKQGNKMIPIGIAAVLLVVLLVIAFVFLFNKKEAYRIIKVYEVNGKATVERESIGQMDAYANMVLESGDTVSLQSGEMTLKLDEDKYVYVEADTQFRLIATGNAANSKTSIALDHGAITNEIQNPLSQDSSYEVNTPNSNMSVRGTVFRVHTYFVDGVRYSKVSVFEGKVESRLRYADGSLAKEPVLIQNGDEVIIYDDEENTDYLGAPHEIAYEELPQSVKELIREILGEDIGSDVQETEDGAEDAGDETDSDAESETGEEGDAPEAEDENSAEMTDDATDTSSNEDNTNVTKQTEDDPSADTQTTALQTTSSYTVTFMYNGNVFGSQTVTAGGLASKPRLMPASSGSWDYDFSAPINGDTTIEWR